MKFLKTTIILITLFCCTLSFNSMAEMRNEEPYEPTRTTPKTELKHEDRTLNYEWTWLNEDICVQFRGGNSTNRSSIQRMYDLGLLTPYRIDGIDQKREAYVGKWSQDESGVWSFIFDDGTIPIDVTSINGIIYAFNGYGELMEGYNYYGDLKTGADGLVATDKPEFLQWLSTQYLPECTSHE